MEARTAYLIVDSSLNSLRVVQYDTDLQVNVARIYNDDDLAEGIYDDVQLIDAVYLDNANTYDYCVLNGIVQDPNDECKVRVDAVDPECEQGNACWWARRAICTLQWAPYAQDDIECNITKSAVMLAFTSKEAAMAVKPGDYCTVDYEMFAEHVF